MMKKLGKKEKQKELITNAKIILFSSFLNINEIIPFKKIEKKGKRIDCSFQRTKTFNYDKIYLNLMNEKIRDENMSSKEKLISHLRLSFPPKKIKKKSRKNENNSSEENSNEEKNNENKKESDDDLNQKKRAKRKYR